MPKKQDLKDSEDNIYPIQIDKNDFEEVVKKYSQKQQSNTIKMLTFPGKILGENINILIYTLNTSLQYKNPKFERILDISQSYHKIVWKNNTLKIEKHRHEESILRIVFKEIESQDTEITSKESILFTQDKIPSYEKFMSGLQEIFKKTKGESIDYKKEIFKKIYQYFININHDKNYIIEAIDEDNNTKIIHNNRIQTKDSPKNHEKIAIMTLNLQKMKEKLGIYLKHTENSEDSEEERIYFTNKYIQKTLKDIHQYAGLWVQMESPEDADNKSAHDIFDILSHEDYDFVTIQTKQLQN